MMGVFFSITFNKLIIFIKFVTLIKHYYYIDCKVRLIKPKNHINKMRQNEFFLRVEQRPDFIDITAWEVGSGYIVNQGVTHLYPQLKKVGLSEELNGQMSYNGELDLKQLKEMLNEWGFIVEGTEKYARYLTEIEKIEEYKCKIEPVSDDDDEEEEVVEEKPLTIEQLQNLMNKAIECEEYEMAANYRDEINNLKK